MIFQIVILITLFQVSQLEANVKKRGPDKQSGIIHSYKLYDSSNHDNRHARLAGDHEPQEQRVALQIVTTEMGDGLDNNGQQQASGSSRTQSKHLNPNSLENAENPNSIISFDDQYADIENQLKRQSSSSSNHIKQPVEMKSNVARVNILDNSNINIVKPTDQKGLSKRIVINLNSSPMAGAPNGGGSLKANNQTITTTRVTIGFADDNNLHKDVAQNNERTSSPQIVLSNQGTSNDRNDDNYNHKTNLVSKSTKQSDKQTNTKSTTTTTRPENTTMTQKNTRHSLMEALKNQGGIPTMVVNNMAEAMRQEMMNGPQAKKQGPLSKFMLSSEMMDPKLISQTTKINNNNHGQPTDRASEDSRSQIANHIHQHTTTKSEASKPVASGSQQNRRLLTMMPLDSSRRRSNPDRGVSASSRTVSNTNPLDYHQIHANQWPQNGLLYENQAGSQVNRKPVRTFQHDTGDSNDDSTNENGQSRQLEDSDEAQAAYDWGSPQMLTSMVVQNKTTTARGSNAEQAGEKRGLQTNTPMKKAINKHLESSQMATTNAGHKRTGKQSDIQEANYHRLAMKGNNEQQTAMKQQQQQRTDERVASLLERLRLYTTRDHLLKVARDLEGFSSSDGRSAGAASQMASAASGPRDVDVEPDSESDQQEGHDSQPVDSEQEESQQQQHEVGWSPDYQRAQHHHFRPGRVPAPVTSSRDALVVSASANRALEDSDAPDSGPGGNEDPTNGRFDSAEATSTVDDERPQNTSNEQQQINHELQTTNNEQPQFNEIMNGDSAVAESRGGQRNPRLRDQDPESYQARSRLNDGDNRPPAQSGNDPESDTNDENVGESRSSDHQELSLITRPDSDSHSVQPGLSSRRHVHHREPSSEETTDNHNKLMNGNSMENRNALVGGDEHEEHEEPESQSGSSLESEMVLPEEQEVGALEEIIDELVRREHENTSN